MKYATKLERNDYFGTYYRRWKKIYDTSVNYTMQDISVNETIINKLENKINSKIDYYVKKILAIYDDMDFIKIKMIIFWFINLCFWFFNLWQ